MVADNTLTIKQKSTLPVSKTRQDKSLFCSLSDIYLPPPNGHGAPMSGREYLPFVRAKARFAGPIAAASAKLESDSRRGRTSGAAERQRDVADIEAAETPGEGLPSRLAPERGCHEVTGVKKSALAQQAQGHGDMPRTRTRLNGLTKKSASADRRGRGTLPRQSRKAT